MNEKEKYYSEIKQVLFKIFQKFLNNVYELFAIKCDKFVEQYVSA
ncbi:MAG: hypothetical protein ACK5K7_00245 [Bacilli bacterium]